MRLTLFACAVFVSALPLFAQEKAKKNPATPKTPVPPAKTPWGDYIEKDFRFFGSVLDCRDLEGDFPKNNLTPRGIILNLGDNLWACFDTDLLRISALWEGEAGKPPVTPDALAHGSYHVAGQKTKDGQEHLTKPIGKVWLANGIYPGWQIGEKPNFTDPREASPSPEEVGRGPLKADQIRFKSLQISSPQTLEIQATLGSLQLTGRIMFDVAQKTFAQNWEIPPHDQPLIFNIGQTPALADLKYSHEKVEAISESQKTYFGIHTNASAENGIQVQHDESRRTWITLPASKESQVLNVLIAVSMPDLKDDEAVHESLKPHWPETVATQGSLSKKPDSYVVDEIPLPVPNPWKRNVRLADISFLDDNGNAAAVTFDGDVWLISGLKGDLEKVTWKRYASGLHEPMSIIARKEPSTGKTQILVFDRNGIWNLVDTNKDKEADRYEMFCNLFTQTAETREFPNSMKLGPEGALYIAKGGQEGTTFGKHNGTVIKIAPDGKSFKVIGHGLRQPFIGVNPKTGLVTASDQQGNYVPSTPIHIIQDNQFYGHLPTIAPEEKYPAPIADPLVWVPHPVNPSGVSQTWLLGSKMGPIDGELIHIGYNRPELFRVLMNKRFKKPQAAIMSFSRDFDFGPLNATVNPADGQLYVTGFQVWGTTAKKLSGLSRLRYTDQPRVLLQEVTPTDKGLILRFNAKLSEKHATDPANYNGERWNYQRTAKYGSPHLKLDGSTGQEWVTPSSAYLSQDGMSVFVGIPDMKAGIHQMRIGYGLESATGLPAANTAYFSPWELATFDPVKEGFGNITVDLTPRKKEVVALAKPTVEEGAKLYQMIGCMACHSIDGSTVGKVGPSWKGLYNSERDLSKGGKSAIADEAYLRESITDPNAKVVKGYEKFDTGMPIYAGILNESQVESLVLYIKTLK